MPASVFGTPRLERVAVLSVDRELAERLAGARRARAEALSVARVLRREPGEWAARQDAGHGRDGLGLLIVEGLWCGGLVWAAGMALSC